MLLSLHYEECRPDMPGTGTANIVAATITTRNGRYAQRMLSVPCIALHRLSFCYRVGIQTNVKR